ncbi:MAG: carbonic anhydrase [Microbacteriaceae bacterium]
MVRGNQRFISGKPRHPRQDVERRSELAERQAPDAALFGCSDSRLAAEIIFDKGLGDLFVVRNAGQVVSDSVLGSLEYAVEVLQVPLIIVLGHDECGAVLAAIAAGGEDPPSLPVHTRAIIDRIIPAVHRVREAEDDPTMTDAQEVGREHLRDTVAELIDSSDSIRRAVDEGRLGIVGANYRLLEGRVVPDIIVGNIEPA